MTETARDAPAAREHGVRFGCCVNMIAAATDPLGAALLPALAAIGFDYVELSLRDVAALQPAALARLEAGLQAAGIPCEACNNFFPPAIRLTGPDVDRSRVVAYADRALECAERLGARVVVFGSGASRLVPDGYPIGDAWRQLTDCLGEVAPGAAQRSITLVVEALNRGETNIVTSLADGLALVREVAHPAVKLLLDCYHASVEGDGAGDVAAAADEIRHVHVAAGPNRLFPAAPDRAASELVGPLVTCGYEGRCSIEAHSADLASDGRRSLSLLKGMFAR